MQEQQVPRLVLRGCIFKEELQATGPLLPINSSFSIYGPSPASGETGLGGAEPKRGTPRAINLVVRAIAMRGMYESCFFSFFSFFFITGTSRLN